MRFICLGFSEEKLWDEMSKSQQDAMIEECFTYDEKLLSGNWTGEGEALRQSATAKTLRRKGGKLIVSDGPYAETKEQLGGFGVLEARDIDHAVELMSRHPGLRLGPFEIRPIDEEVTNKHSQEKSEPSAAPTQGCKVICLAYGDESKWSALAAGERGAMIDECIAYCEQRMAHAGWVGGAALQGASTAKTLRSKGGKVIVTDGPYAETKEQLGGVAIFTFRDMDEAVESWSDHPCLRAGDTLELRPADEEFNARFAERMGRAVAR